MPTYSLTAITIGSFHLGESDKVLTLFSSERGIVRAVAKGARKPGTKISGRADVLNVNNLLLAKGKSLDIITQAEGVETFRALRQDLERLSYSLYYAELTSNFGQGLSEESDLYFEFLVSSIRGQSDGKGEASMLCLEFELQLLDLLGYKPELDACVICRTALNEYLLAAFHYDLGGIICEPCFKSKRRQVRENNGENSDLYVESMAGSGTTHITPLVWKRLVIAAQTSSDPENHAPNANIVRANQACRPADHSVLYRASRRETNEVS